MWKGPSAVGDVLYFVPFQGVDMVASQASGPLCRSCVDIPLASQCPGRTLQDIHTLGPPLPTPRRAPCCRP